MYRVLLIDDDNTIADSLCRELNRADYPCQLVGAATDAEEGARMLHALRPHIVFTNLWKPGQGGLSVVAGWCAEFPDMQITILTGCWDLPSVQDAIDRGVTRFLFTPVTLEQMREALNAMIARLDRLNIPRGQGLSEAPNAGSYIVNQALEYMEENYSRKITLQSVADSCYVSQWYMSKLLNRYAGKSFYDILNTIRIHNAKQLLAGSCLKVGEIGEMVGYSDSAHFARIFKKLEGVSANAFRKRQQRTLSAGVIPLPRKIAG